MTQEDSIKTNQAATVIDFIIKHRTRFSAKLLIWATCGITRALHSNVPANPAGAHIGVLEPLPFLHHIKKCPFYVCVFFFFLWIYNIWLINVYIKTVGTAHWSQDDYFYHFIIMKCNAMSPMVILDFCCADWNVQLSIKDWLITTHMYLVYLETLCCQKTQRNLPDGQFANIWKKKKMCVTSSKGKHCTSMYSICVSN